MSFYVVVINRLEGRASRPIDGGFFKERNDAVAAAQRVVDAWLFRNFKRGLSAPSLLEKYLDVGEIPSIFGDQSRTQGSGFDYTEYALKRANELMILFKSMDT